MRQKGLWKQAVALLVAVSVLTGLLCACGEQRETSPSDSGNKGARVITDMRGKEVSIPADPQRVAILDKGFIVQVMAAMDMDDRIVASGGLVQSTSTAEERDSLYLCPQLLELPQIGYPTDAVDFETLAAAKPDLVILRNSEYIKDSEVTAQAIDRIENDLHIPLVVINGPGVYDEVRLETQYEGIALIGEIFQQQQRAEEIINLLQKQIKLIEERTAEIEETEKPSVMYLGLSGQDTVGTVWGENFGDAKFSGEVANIRNVYAVHGREKMSAEQIVSLAPEVIILCTNSVRPNPTILSEDPAYASLRTVPAVQNGRVTSIGLLTWWGDFRLEFPTILMIAAKSAYPERFADIRVGEWLNDFHQQLYRIDEAGAQTLKQVQQLDWMDDAQF